MYISINTPKTSQIPDRDNRSFISECITVILLLTSPFNLFYSSIQIDHREQPRHTEKTSHLTHKYVFSLTTRVFHVHVHLQILSQYMLFVWSFGTWNLSGYCLNIFLCLTNNTCCVYNWDKHGGRINDFPAGRLCHLKYLTVQTQQVSMWDNTRHN